MSKNRWEKTGERPNWLSQPQRDIDSERSKMVDIDNVFFCHLCQTGILLVEEEKYHGEPIESKCVDVTRWVAGNCKTPAYVAQVHTKYITDDFEDEPLEGFEDLRPKIEVIDFIKIMRVWPTFSKVKVITVEQYQDLTMGARDHHEEDCSHPTGLRWDRKLRKDVPVKAFAQHQ